MDKKCMFPKCTNIVTARGLCHKHYGTANFLVYRGTTTWDELIKNNKALPSGKGISRSVEKQWFLKK